MPQEKTSRQLNAKWYASAKLSTLHLLVLTLALVLFFSGCALQQTSATQNQSKQQTRTSRTDTTAHATTTITHHSVPTQTTHLVLPLSTLERYPIGIEFSEREGRATAAVRIDTIREAKYITITATCDSLQRQIDTYTEQLSVSSHRTDTIYQQISQSKFCPITLKQIIMTAFLSFVIGIVATIATLLVYRAVKRNK